MQLLPHTFINQVTMLILIVFVIIQITGTAEQPLSKDEELALERTVNALRTCKHIPGLGVAIVRNGSVFTGGYGDARISNGKPFDKNTISNIGSTGKAFTVALLAILMTESKNSKQRFDWNSKVTEVTGQRDLFKHHNMLSEMTIKDMLTHRTGLMNPDITINTVMPNISRAEYMRRIRYLPVKEPFRDIHSYNNFVYMMAGHIAEIIGGKPFEDLIKEKILKPLKMESTLFLEEMYDNDRNAAYPYYLHNDSLVEGSLQLYRLGDFNPAGGLCSSPHDLAKWIQFLLDKGTTVDGDVLIAENIFKEIFMPHVTISTRRMDRYSLYHNFPASQVVSWYGYAWFGAIYKGYAKLFHTGWLHAYSTVAGLFPEKNSGFFITVNGPIFDFRTDYLPLTYYLSDVILHENSWLNASTLCTFPEPWEKRKAKKHIKHEVASSQKYQRSLFYGNYGHYIFGDLRIFENAHPNRLSFKLNSVGKGHFLLLLQQTPTFSIHYEEVLSNVMGKHGKAIFLRLEGGHYQQVNITFESEMYDFHRGIQFSHYIENTSSAIQVHQQGFGLTTLLITCIHVIIFSRYSY